MSIIGIAAGPVVTTTQGTTPVANQVLNVATVGYGYGASPASQSTGKQGELLASNIHSSYYVAAQAGCAFTTSVPASATLTIPTTLATLASKFCIVNPAGSGKVMEMFWLDYFVASATEVVNVLGFTKSTLTTAVLATLTAGVINNTSIGNPNNISPVGIFYNAATHADTPVWFKSIMSINATAVGKFYDRAYLDGFLLYPGNCIDLVASTGAQANSIPDLVWGEWLLP